MSTIAGKEEDLTGSLLFISGGRKRMFTQSVLTCEHQIFRGSDLVLLVCSAKTCSRIHIDFI